MNIYWDIKSKFERLKRKILLESCEVSAILRIVMNSQEDSVTEDAVNKNANGSVYEWSLPKGYY